MKKVKEINLFFVTSSLQYTCVKKKMSSVVAESVALIKNNISQINISKLVYDTTNILIFKNYSMAPDTSNIWIVLQPMISLILDTSSVSKKLA